MLKSEGTGGFLHLQKNIPNFYPKLLHPARQKSSNWLYYWRIRNVLFLKTIARQELEPKSVKDSVAWCQKSLLCIRFIVLEIDWKIPQCWIAELNVSIATKLVVCLPKLGLLEGMVMLVVKVSSDGVQNWKDFCLKINIPKGNYWILRIGLMGRCQKVPYLTFK